MGRAPHPSVPDSQFPIPAAVRVFCQSGSTTVRIEKTASVQTHWPSGGISPHESDVQEGCSISTTEERTSARQTDDHAALVARAQRGDDAAFDALYARTVGRVYAVCLRLCADRAEAERLTQDTFVQAWQRMKSFRGESRFTSWLHRIAVNTVLQDRRSAGRREARVRIAADEELAGVADRPGQTELQLDLERAIAELPVGARTALVLHDIEGYTHQEIATMLGLAAGTIKAQLHRARQLLQQRLEP